MPRKRDGFVPLGDVAAVELSGDRALTHRAAAPDQHCRTVLPITLIRQYRFVTPKSLKTRSGRGRCRTVPLRNPVY